MTHSLFDQVFVHASTKKAIPLILTQDKKIKNAWAALNKFEGTEGQICLIPDTKNGLKEIWVGHESNNPWLLAALPSKIPEGLYELDTKLTGDELNHMLVGFVLGFYQFDQFKKNKKDAPKIKLVFPKKADKTYVKALTDAICQVRDLINTPAEILTPLALADAAQQIAKKYKAGCTLVTDQKKLKKEYPLVHAVGKGSTNPACLIDLRWGDKKHPKITLVGKGITFDTGGLNLKPDSGMRLMKKDMGGAAHALGLARIIMELNLPVQLRVLIPAAENAISADAMRPLDIIPSRKGLTVEIGHTDAEGRLVLADALFEACKDKPDLLIDFATLTGAARAALGPDVPALFSNDDKTAQQLVKLSQTHHEFFWQMPLHQPYRTWIQGRTADLCNVASGSLSSEISLAGAITASLFLQEFIEPNITWVHLDLFAWSNGNKPGRPEGGDAMGFKTLLTFIKNFKKLTKN